MTEKATALERRHKCECVICKMIDVDNKAAKWHLYKEAVCTMDEDEWICEDCVNTIKDINKKCRQKADNPHHDVFKDFTPWFAPQVQGMAEAFKELSK